jgi:phage-related protein
MPAGFEPFIKNQASLAPVLLADIQTADGAQYFWADVEGTYLSKITGAQQFYYGWLKRGQSFSVARDLTTSAGDVVVQNLSGNTIGRDVQSALVNHEFEGALCIVRIWLPLFDASMTEFHGYLAEQNPVEDEASFRHLQLFDPAQYDVCNIIISELCPWRYQSAQCGSAGTATTCDKKFTTCSATDHAAQERFSGVLTIVPNAGIVSAFVGPGGGSGRPIFPKRYLGVDY